VLTTLQRDRLRVAIAAATGSGKSAWVAGGPLAQLALLEGATPQDLARWDALEDEDGPITARRLQESGNAFQGWPLDVLETIDAEWCRGGSVAKVLDVVEREAARTNLPGGKAMPNGTNGYSGPERRGALTVAVDLKGLLLLIGLIGPLVAVITMVLQQRQDVRSNSVRVTALEVRQNALETRYNEDRREWERARTIFCTARKTEDSIRARVLPDIGC
jgi:hypothetical protein